MEIVKSIVNAFVKTNIFPVQSQKIVLLAFQGSFRLRSEIEILFEIKSTNVIEFQMFKSICIRRLINPLKVPILLFSIMSVYPFRIITTIAIFVVVILNFEEGLWPRHSEFIDCYFNI